jgi:hypothetical protein
MKRAPDKIKDFVDGKTLEEVANLAGNPARALQAYRFTPATSELMSRWLDVFAGLAPHQGAARALAGFRGVGKSHMLASFGAVVELPDLRSGIDETHVRVTAQRLGSTPYTVVRVERGSRPTLLEELRAGFAAAFFTDESDWELEPGAMLAVAASRAGTTPVAVLIDTSFGRQTRVHRDDGPLLSELAKATEQVRAFIGLALDDDISGADGVNVSLIGSYQIDYLDPEHLFQVLDHHVFQKTPQSRAALHEVYTGLREAIPAFNWSEPRFTTLYPLHPLVADVSPAIRLFAPTFALLPFAASVFTRVTNRPAHSLVTLDEVFDRVEHELRKADDLRDPFRAYDRLATEVLGQVPVMQRLHARLALKGLFLLSLDGHGASASELCAAMLLYDEASPGTPFEGVAEMLELFAADPEAKLLRQIEEGGELRYAFGVSASAGFEAALAAAAENVSNDAVDAVWRGLARVRFPDWPFHDTDLFGVVAEMATFSITWRGLGRSGRIVWNSTDDGLKAVANGSDGVGSGADLTDWEVSILSPLSTRNSGSGFDAFPVVGDESDWGSASVLWLPGAVTSEEQGTIKRLATLRTDGDLHAEFGDTVSAAERTHTALAERIWSRVYLDSGMILAGNARRNLPAAARTSATLAETLTVTLAPLFAARFPLHPEFTESLGATEVAHLVGKLFGGANQGAQSVQELARLFALPLGLVALRGDVYTLEAGDTALTQPWTREVLAIIDQAEGETVPIEQVYRRLSGEPYGLPLEAQQLVLAGLVAQRRLELVLSSGERIARRMLDLKLAWDEIQGVARSAALLHSAEELTEWARLLSGDERLASISEPSAREEVRKALSGWLERWRASKSVEAFESLPDEALTTRSWRLASGVRRSFGAAADAVEAALVDAISLEEGLQRAADAFADSIELFVERSKQLEQIRNFLTGLSQRDQVIGYLSAAEPTTINEIENARSELSFLLSDLTRFFDLDSNKRFELLWKEFHSGYRELYASRHAEVVGAESFRAEIDAITRGREWREFESLSALPVFGSQHWERANALLQSVRETKCDLNVKQILAERPFCACHFRLADAGTIATKGPELQALVRSGLAAYRATLKVLHAPLAIAFDAIARKETDPDLAARARAWSSACARNEDFSAITPLDVRLLELALHRMSNTTSVSVRVPAESFGILTREELKVRLNQWVDALPIHPALMEVTTSTNGDE